MLEETKTQQNVLEALIKLPQAFWSNFVYRENDEPVHSGTYKISETGSIQPSLTLQNSSPHNSFDWVRRSSRKIYLTDDSMNSVKSKSDKFVTERKFNVSTLRHQRKK